jgi:hypothetical protein
MQAHKSAGGKRIAQKKRWPLAPKDKAARLGWFQA